MVHMPATDFDNLVFIMSVYVCEKERDSECVCGI